MMWRLASAAWLLALALPVPAQSNTRTGSGNTKVFVVLAKLDSELVDWFDHLSSSVNQIADQEDKSESGFSFSTYRRAFTTSKPTDMIC